MRYQGPFCGLSRLSSATRGILKFGLRHELKKNNTEVVTKRFLPETPSMKSRTGQTFSEMGADLSNALKMDKKPPSILTVRMRSQCEVGDIKYALSFLDIKYALRFLSPRRTHQIAAERFASSILGPAWTPYWKPVHIGFNYGSLLCTSYVQKAEA